MAFMVNPASLFQCLQSPERLCDFVTSTIAEAGKQLFAALAPIKKRPAPFSRRWPLRVALGAERLYNVSIKLRNLSEREGCLSFRSTLASRGDMLVLDHLAQV
jgi:hypothetical protein